MRWAALVTAVALLSCSESGSPPVSADASDGAPTVVDAGDGAAIVSWVAPTTRTDGSKLATTAIGGYKVHYGTKPGTYTTVVDVGRVASHRIAGLTAGSTYYFAVSVYDLVKRQSKPSAEASKTFP